MQTLPWLTLDALQAGALLALAATFGADALHRRDRMMGWLAACCVLVAFRHGIGVLDLAHVLPMDEGDRLQSALASLGFMALARALALIFPAFYPRYFLGVFVAGAIPNLVRCAALPLDNLAAKVLHGITLGTYLWACGATVWVLFRAHRSKDPLGVRLLAGLIVTMVPVVVEILARMVFGVAIRVSGVSILLMAITVGVSWVWVQTLDLQARREALEAEAKAWRSLLPGATWHSSERSAVLDGLVGGRWRTRIGERVLARDGRLYTLRGLPLPDGAQVGWLEPLHRAPGDGGPFLQGWTVGLGLDDPDEADRVRGWLEAWGAQVEPWGTVPPREGPFPSLLLWGREPSILAVWREYDLARRRCRWIQIGGHPSEGPHARVERPLEAEALRTALQGLLALQQV